MELDIFESTKNWSFSADEIAAEERFKELSNEARENLPKGFFAKQAPLHLTLMGKTRLYAELKRLPKAVLHNVFLDCCQDLQFFRTVVALQPNLYLTKDWASFRVGTAEQALHYGWLPLDQARAMYKSELDFIRALTAVTTFSEQELASVCKQEKNYAWAIFASKQKNTHTLLNPVHIFRKYVQHVLIKFARNGYQRVEFRSQLMRLTEYDADGRILRVLSDRDYINTIEEALEGAHKQAPGLTIGFIFYGKKSLSDEQNEAVLKRVCDLNWNKTVGFDFVQEEDLYGSLRQFDAIVDRLLAHYPHLRYKKVYHAGQTNDHRSHNIDIAIQAGAVRVGHGLNILRRIQVLPYCRSVCFEKCPLSNLMLGYTGDPRESSAPILLGLGYPVSLNIGDAGKFGVQDSTPDYFVSAVSYNWTLKHLKLVIIHSINHALCQQHERKQIFVEFNRRWQEWVSLFLEEKHGEKHQRTAKSQDIFSSTRNWSYSNADELAEAKFEELRNRQLNLLPKGFYRVHTLTHLQHMRASDLFDLLKDIPKGVLHHDHFDCNEDEDFYRLHIITDPNVYLASDRSCFKIGTKQEATVGKWVSFSKLREEFANQRQLVHFISNKTMLNKQELFQVSCNQPAFWALFETKIQNFFIILYAAHIFKKYVRHVLLKYIRNGYSRIQFRALLSPIKEYDSEGRLVADLGQKGYLKAFDEVYDEVRASHPYFSAGFIFFGLKALSQQQNFALLDQALSHEWPLTVAIDFVQQEDPHGSMEPYIRVGDRLIRKYAHLNLQRAYHAGQTKDHLNSNVELSVKAGAVRIGHGLNIVKRIESLALCKGVCFQLNPISNLLTGGMTDVRTSTAPLLLGLGHSVSISSDDPGKFGYQDTTVDYFVAAVSFNWTLKHLKLIAYHSINHAITTEGNRLAILQRFNQQWDQWIQSFLKRKDSLDLLDYPKRAALPLLDYPTKRIHM